jgi:hypothetical protein
VISQHSYLSRGADFYSRVYDETRQAIKDKQVGPSSLASYSTQRIAGTIVKKLFGGNFDQMVLGRLDRLTLDEGRIASVQIRIRGTTATVPHYI